MCAKLLQLCMPGSSVHGIFRARILDWVDIHSSRGSSQPWNQIRISYIGRQVLYSQHQLRSQVN